MLALANKLSLRGAGRKLGFRPTDDPGVNLWMEGQYRVQHGVGPDDPATDGETVRRWVNRANPGTYDANQTTGSQQPIFNADEYSLLFDGINDSLIIEGPITVQAIMVAVRGGVLGSTLSSQFPNVSFDRMGFLFPNSATWYAGDVNDLIGISQVNNVTTSVHNPAAWEIVYGASVSPLNLAGLIIGDGSLSNAWAGDIGAYIAWDSTPSAVNKAKTFNYLASIYL